MFFAGFRPIDSAGGLPVLSCARVIITIPGIAINAAMEVPVIRVVSALRAPGYGFYHRVSGASSKLPCKQTRVFVAKHTACTSEGLVGPIDQYSASRPSIVLFSS